MKKGRSLLSKLLSLGEASSGIEKKPCQDVDSDIARNNVICTRGEIFMQAIYKLKIEPAQKYC